jgi:hypothetical protein
MIPGLDQADSRPKLAGGHAVYRLTDLPVTTAGGRSTQSIPATDADRGQIRLAVLFAPGRSGLAALHAAAQLASESEGHLIVVVIAPRTVLRSIGSEHPTVPRRAAHGDKSGRPLSSRNRINLCHTARLSALG